MSLSYFFKELASKLITDQEIYVRIVWRDDNGYVVRSQMAPISWISGAMDKDLNINIEASELVGPENQDPKASD